MIIAVDFDGTCVTHEFPKVGKDIGAAEILRKLVKNGHKIILNTMRGDEKKVFTLENGNTWYCNPLIDAVSWFRENDIPLYGINENPSQKRWTTSPKVFAHLYIDDMALGCPLINNLQYSIRPYVDWRCVEKYLKQNDII